MLNIKRALAAGVPLIAVESNDAAQTTQQITAQLNGKFETCPVLRYDVSNGLVALNNAGADRINAVLGDTDALTMPPYEVLLNFTRAAEREARADDPVQSFIIVHNPQLFWAGEKGAFFVQGAWNARDIFKQSGSQLYLIVPPGTSLPIEIRNDAIVLKDELPTRDEIKAIVKVVADSAQLTTKQIGNLDQVLDTLTGIPPFAVEQVLAMSVTRSGLDHKSLWARKKQTIDQTPGLTVWQGGETFDQVGGYEFIVQSLRARQNGKRPAKVYVWMDEFEKMINTTGGDNTGVAQDQLRSLLTWMQDNAAVGAIFIGAGGSGKSMIAKAAGNDAGVPTIALDLGAMKGSLVGQSEQNIRAALDVIKSISGGSVFFIATCNSIGMLPPEMKRRFTDGIYYFPLPDDAARKAIWGVYFKKYSLPEQPLPDDKGWTGAEIKNCAERADDLGITLVEAARSIVPVSVSDREVLERLSTSAHMRYIDAAKGGMYRDPNIAGSPVTVTTKLPGGRRIERGDE